MKKVVAILFAVLFLLGVTACQKASAPDTSPEYKFETDCQYNYRVANINGYFTETDDSIYRIDEESYLRVIDKKTMQETFLCAKPNCLHGQDIPESDWVVDNFECNAYVGADPSGTICSYSGALYCIIRKDRPSSPIPDFVFTEISADGFGRKELLTLSFGQDEEADFGLPNFFIHRGIVYFSSSLYRTDEETGEQIDLGDRIYTYDLTTKKVKKIYANERSDGILLSNVYALGNYLYGIFMKDGELDSSLWKFNLSTQESTYLDYGNRILPVGDKLLSYHFDFEMMGEKKEWDHWVELSDLDGENREVYPVLNFNDHPQWAKVIQSDGKYVFVTDSAYSDMTTEIRVYDFASGEKIASLPLPDGMGYIGDRAMSCTQDGKLLAYSHLPFNEKGELLDMAIFYCDISTIGTPDFQWFEVEKVN